MARRGLSGQLNMFDLFNSMESPGEVEMVSLVPEYEDEPEPPVACKKEEAVAMSRSYVRDGKRIEIAYLNYNKVRIQEGNKEPQIKVFATSKEAVDYYVEVMQEYEIDE